VVTSELHEPNMGAWHSWVQMIQWFWGLRHEMVEDELRIVITYYKLDYPQIQTT
jgi:hypothetical protein